MNSPSLTSHRTVRNADKTRGFVLVAVLVVLAAAILIATGSIFAARSATAASRASIAEERLRSAALDGVALAVDAIARDRARILAGGTPELESALLERVDGEERIEVQLVAMPLGGFAEPEGAKFPLARFDASLTDVLGKSNGADEAREAIFAALANMRDGTSVESVLAQLAEADRVRALKALLGPLRTATPSDDRVHNERASDDAELPVISLLSAHARESLVDASGTERLDLVAATGAEDSVSEGAGGTRVEERRSDAALEAFDEAELKAIEESVRDVPREPDDGKIAQACLARGVSLSRREEILTKNTLHSGKLAPARLDLLRAPRPVLEAFAQAEDLSDGFAERVESVRESLDPAERTNTAWLVERRVLSAEEHARIAGRVTSRSTAWRFRVVAQLVVGRDDFAAPERLTTSNERSRSSREGESSGTNDSRGGALAAFDAIVEVGGRAPRLVYLREVSLLDTARALGLALIDRASENADRALETSGGEATSPDVLATTTQSTGTEVDETSRDGFPSAFEPAKLDEPSVAPTRPRRVRSDPFGRDVGSAGAPQS